MGRGDDDMDDARAENLAALIRLVRDIIGEHDRDLDAWADGLTDIDAGPVAAASGGTA